MGRHGITKTINFCYGHRLLDYDGKCKHLHGHNGLLEIEIKSASLDKLGMVMDFNVVKDAVKGWVDSNLDHRMILCRRDPAVEILKKMGEPMYVLDDNPTAENIAKHIFEIARKQRIDVHEVRLWETPSSYATYRVS